MWKPLTDLVLMSVLRPQLDSVNMVNAPVIAASRNIRVSETKRDRNPDYQTLIRVKMVANHGDYVAAGSLFGAGKPRDPVTDGAVMHPPNV